MSLLTQHKEYFLAALVLVAAGLIGVFVRRIVLRGIRRITDRTANKLDDALLLSTQRPIVIWFLLGGIYFAANIVRLPKDWARLGTKLISALMIVSVTLWFADLAVRVFLRSSSAMGDKTLPVTGVVRNLVYAAILLLGGLALLATFGVSITPFLTTLGVGGIAVALGLQDTLANLFAGVHVSLSGSIRSGDFIRLQSGEEGYVEDIQWRCTNIRTFSNNRVVIPNSKLAQSLFTNYHLPEKDVFVTVEVPVHHASDLALVERVTIEVAQEIMKSVPGGVPEHAPTARFSGFDDTVMRMNVNLKALEVADSYLVKHEFIRALMKRYHEHHIVIPAPVRAIDITQERAADAIWARRGPREPA